MPGTVAIVKNSFGYTLGTIKEFTPNGLAVISYSKDGKTMTTEVHPTRLFSEKEVSESVIKILTKAA